MDESLLTNDNDTNVTKETEASLSYEEYKPSKAKDLRSHIITAVGLNLLDIIKENNPEKLALSIGDGANDVGMILEADVGVGIQGKEGVEAARASDYSLPEFCFLQKLLLYHGREDYRRNSYYIIYEFYNSYYSI